MTEKIKVVVSGIHFPLSMMTYFIRAFQRREDVELITAGPFTGDYIPWKGGMRLPPKYVYTPTIPLPQQYIDQRGLNPSFIEVRLPWIPDLWLQVDAGWWLKKPNAKVVAHVATDPHCLQYAAQRQQCDIFFNMQTPYMQPGDVYLPYAFDPTVHYPEPQVEKVYDACLIGLHYSQRDLLVNRLRAKGLNVYYDLGLVFDEYRHLYAQSKVALSWSSMADTPTRVFEAMGMGIPLVANRTPDLMNLFGDGTHFFGFDNVDQAEFAVTFLLNNPTIAEYVSKKALEEVDAKHSWDRRVQFILEKSGLVP